MPPFSFTSRTASSAPRCSSSPNVAYWPVSGVVLIGPATAIRMAALAEPVPAVTDVTSAVARRTARTRMAASLVGLTPQHGHAREARQRAWRLPPLATGLILAGEPRQGGGR